MSEILVAGCGHGGIVAAIKLAEAGHNITVFEQNEKGNIGMPQSDAFDYDTFTYAHIPVAPYFKRGKNSITFIPSDNTVTPLTIPSLEQDSYIVDRRELIEYLISLAEDAGVKICCNTTVLSPILLGNRVAGLKTSAGDFYCDLVIDACGVNSPVRCGLPKQLLVDREIKKYDVLYSYRAYFERNQNAPEPRYSYSLYLRDDGTVGFSWLITELDRTDALVCRFYKPENNEILDVLRNLQEENPQMGTDLIYGGSYAVIPVCQPLAKLVADGYAAVGDSAFMTVPVKGSGITYSIKAGKILADCVIADKNGFYDTEALWNYQHSFFKEIGFSGGRLAILKNILPFLTAEQVNDLFRLNIITSEEISAIMTDKADLLFSKGGLTKLKNKIKLASDNNTIKDILSNVAVWIGKLAVIEASFPTKYDRKDIAKWVERYNSFFDSIRKTDKP